MLNALTKLIFGDQPKTEGKLSLVCDSKKILSVSTAQVLNEKFAYLLKRKQYVVFDHCSTRGCQFMNVTYVDERGKLQRRSWPSEKETEVAIKALSNQGYVQVTFSE